MNKNLGNILTSENVKKFDRYFNVCQNFNNIDITIPTLIIGLDNAKKYIKDFNILQKKYDNNIWWTFSRFEKRNIYEEDIKAFYNFCLTLVLDNIKYKYINIFKLKYNKLKNSLLYIESCNTRVVTFNENNRFLYFYCSKFNTVYGLSLTDLEYCGIDYNKILNKIKANKNFYFVENFNFLPSDIKYKLGDKIHCKLVLFDYFYN